METMFGDLVKASPMLGLCGALIYYITHNYTALVNSVREDSVKREERLQSTITENQNVIKNLTDKLIVVEDIKDSVDKLEQDMTIIKTKVV